MFLNNRIIVKMSVEYIYRYKLQYDNQHGCHNILHGGSLSCTPMRNYNCFISMIFGGNFNIFVLIRISNAFRERI